MHKIVITGLGVVSPLGAGVDISWKSLLSGHCAARNLTLCEGDFRRLGQKVGNAQVAAPLLQVKTDNVFKHPRHLGFALAAATEAMTDAALPFDRCIGVAFGCGMPGLDQTEAFLRQERRASPYLIYSLLASTPASFLCKELGLKRIGPVTSPSAACATGSQAIIDAFNMLQSDDAVDAIIAGATETPINYTSICGFHTIRALSTRFNATPEQASRPFDAQRDGFVLGEGAGAVVLERLERAKQRGAHIYAEIVGVGATVDESAHPTLPDPKGRGAKMAIEKALLNADRSAVKAVYAHGTGTPLGDDIELGVISSLFKSDILVTAPKASIGHALGASGAIELAFACKSLQSNIVPGIASLQTPIMHAPNVKLSKEPVAIASPVPWIILKNSFGFGGINCAVAIKQYLASDG